MVKKRKYSPFLWWEIPETDFDAMITNKRKKINEGASEFISLNNFVNKLDFRLPHYFPPTYIKEEDI